MPSRRTASLDSTLVRLVLLAVLPVLAASGALIAKVWWEERRALDGALLQGVASLSADLDREFASSRVLLETLANSPLIDDGDWRRFHAMARESLRSRPDTWLVVFDAEARALLSTSQAFDAPTPDPRLLAGRPPAETAGDQLPIGSAAYAQESLRTGKPVFSDLYESLVAGRPLLALNVPVLRDGNVRYVLSLHFPPDALDDVVRLPHRLDGADAAVVDRRGFFIARRQSPDKAVGKPAPVALRDEIAEGRTGLSEAINPDGVAMYRATARSELSGWTSVVAIPQAAAAAPIRDSVFLWSAVTALMVLLGLFGAQRVARRLSEPIAVLARNAGAVHRGEPPPRSRSSIREIEQLSTALVDAARTERRYDELRRLQEWSEVAQRAGGVGFFDYDFATDRALWTEGIARLLGVPFTRSEYSGAEWLRMLVPEDAEHRLARLRERIAEGAAAFENEFRVVLPDGTTRRLVERARIEYDDAGRAVRLVGVNMDVTDLRQAQEARDESEARFRAFMDNSPFKAWIKDDRGHYLFLNRAGLRYKRRADYVGTVLADHFPPETAAYMRRTDRIVLETGAPYRFVEQVSEGGEPRDYLTVKFPIVRGEVQLVAGVSVDVTDQRRAERALERAGEQKDRFLATLSHELRNPLAPIRNAVSLLKAAESDPARVAWSREIIERQVNHLVHLIDDLLDISRITRDKLQLRRETVALDDVIGAAVESVRPLFEQRGQELAVAEAPAPVIVDVDPTRLAQVVANLLSNASKYTPPGGRIDLRIAVKRDEIVIRVRDTGIGIAAEHVPHLFEMFYQVPGSDAEVQGGLGIGLALVRELVRLHGGRVSAESPGPGQGATFTVVLPRTIGTPRRGALRPGARAGLAGARNCRVLVADDNRDAADSLALVLALMGYTVKTVYDGAAAVEEVDAFAPDVAVLDIGMPQMNGYLAAEAIRAGGKSVVLVALTGWGQQADREKAAAAGFDHHFTKPVDAEALGAFLDRITRERPVRAPGG